jgi:hypothetical protein
MSRLLTGYLIGVAIVVILLTVGLIRDEALVTIAGVVIALAIGLLTFVPQLLAANEVRYYAHKEYFAQTLLPQAGNMELIMGRGVIALPINRIAWKLRDDRSPLAPGFGETPLFDGMLRPHLRTGGTESSWSDFATAFFQAEQKVKDYTAARREYDAAFSGRLEQILQEKIGEGFRAVWFEQRAMDRPVTQSKFAPATYNAGNFQSACELAYSGRFESDPGNRWEYFLPTAVPEEPSRGMPWRVKVGTGDGRDYLWGGPAPANLGSIERNVRAILESLRDDTELRRLFLLTQDAERSAKGALLPLPVLAGNAAVLLLHGPDIPGTCPYCKAWSPRL